MCVDRKKKSYFPAEYKSILKLSFSQNKKVALGSRCFQSRCQPGCCSRLGETYSVFPDIRTFHQSSDVTNETSAVSREASAS